MTKQLKTLLVGQHFKPPAKALLAALPQGAKVTIIPEPDNPYDSEALLVVVETSEIDESSLDEAMLAGMGQSLSDVMEQESWTLGHVAASGGKPLLKAKAAGADDLIGTKEVHAAANDEWPQEAKVEVRGDGTVVLMLDVGG